MVSPRKSPSERVACCNWALVGATLFRSLDGRAAARGQPWARAMGQLRPIRVAWMTRRLNEYGRIQEHMAMLGQKMAGYNRKLMVIQAFGQGFRGIYDAIPLLCLTCVLVSRCICLGCPFWHDLEVVSQLPGCRKMPSLLCWS